MVGCDDPERKLLGEVEEHRESGGGGGGGIGATLADVGGYSEFAVRSMRMSSAAEGVTLPLR